MWEVDLMGVDLVGVDFMRVDFVGPIPYYDYSSSSQLLVYRA